MPEISRFFGIAVTMYHNDHGTPHFHAYYGDDQASFAIGDLQILEGKLIASSSEACSRMCQIASA